MAFRASLESQGKGLDIPFSHYEFRQDINQNWRPALSELDCRQKGTNGTTNNNEVPNIITIIFLLKSKLWGTEAL